jgi:probable addiction module antidote protein
VKNNIPETFAPYDSADYIKNDDDAKSYLEACFDEAGDDSAFIAHALGVVARSGNMAELARKTGVSREGLYKALSTDGNPSFATVLKVTNALGLKLTVQTV